MEDLFIVALLIIAFFLVNYIAFVKLGNFIFELLVPLTVGLLYGIFHPIEYVKESKKMIESFFNK